MPWQGETKSKVGGRESLWAQRRAALAYHHHHHRRRHHYHQVIVMESVAIKVIRVMAEQRHTSHTGSMQRSDTHRCFVSLPVAGVRSLHAARLR